MKFEIIKEILKGIPHTPPEDGLILYNFILENKLQNVLELGFQHGVSTLYMAAAMDDIGSGNITTIDNLTAKEVEPTIIELADRAGLNKYINPIFANSSYNWELMKFIEQNTKDNNCTPIFDFCFIDGAHNWETDGFAFFLVDKLLKKDSLILFDDLYWSYSESKGLKDTDFVNNMASDEKNTPQVELIIKYLVAQHPNYEIIEIRDRWAWVKKKGVIEGTNIDNLYLKQPISKDIKYLIKKIISKMNG